MNLIEEFTFKISITIDNEMTDGSFSVVETDEIVLSVKCSEDTVAVDPSFAEAVDLGKEAQFNFETFSCEPSDCCKLSY